MRLFRYRIGPAEFAAKPTSTVKIMDRDDVLLWLALAWFVALFGASIVVLFWLP
jgi:hypothetical protein